MLLEPQRAMDLTIEIIGEHAGMFYDLRHQAIWAAAHKLWKESKGIDMLTLTQGLREAGMLDEVGGIAFLNQIMDATPSAGNLPAYLDTLKRKHVARQMLRALRDGAARLMEDADPTDALTAVEREVIEVNQDAVRVQAKPFKRLVKECADRIDEFARGHKMHRGPFTGFNFLDNMLCGIAPGELMVLGARPGAGKTSIGLNMVTRMALDQKIPCAVFSLEMSEMQVADRIVFSEARVDWQRRFRNGFLATGDVPKLDAAMARLAAAPLHIEVEKRITAREIMVRARRLQRQKGVQVVLVDYAQLVEPSERSRSGNREQEVAEISSTLAQMAKELNLVTIVAAQLNRESEKGGRARVPGLSDLRESGALEADADIVGLMWSPPAMNDASDDTVVPEWLNLCNYLEHGKEAPPWNEQVRYVEMVIAKNRSGPTGSAAFAFYMPHTRFEDMYRPHKKQEAPPAETKPEIDDADVPPWGNREVEL